MKLEFRADTKRARALRKTADAFTGQSELAAALDAARRDPKRHAAALKSPEAFLKRAGLSLPEGLGLELFEHAPRYLPFPEWTPFVIELSLCRHYWVIECEDAPKSGRRECKLVERELCLGFRVYPRPWPRGPFTL